MRKLFNEFFYIPKHGKVREKVMLTRLVSTITVVIICLVAMSITAYAYFSCNITSGSNIIKAAHFETKISIQTTDKNGEAVDIDPITSDSQMHKFALKAGVQYSIKVELAENSTARTGYIAITAVGCDKTYHTQQLGVDEIAPGGKTTSIKFRLMPTDSTDITFLSNWGTSSYYDDYKNNGDSQELYITGNEEVKMIVNGITKLKAKKGENSDDATDKGEEATDTVVESTTPPSSTTTPSSTPSSSTPSDSQTNPSTTPPTTITTPSEITDVSESTSTQEPASTEPTSEIEQTDPQESTETVPDEEPTEVISSEVSE